MVWDTYFPYMVVSLMDLMVMNPLGSESVKKMTNYKQTVQNYNPWKSLATIFYRLVSEPPLF